MTRVEKVWGHEEILVNDEIGNYCMKRMQLRPRARCSLHHHDVKHETFVVESGRLHLQLGEGADKVLTTLCPGQQQIIRPGLKHLFWSHVPTTFVEVSTYDRPEDSIRTDRSEHSMLDSFYEQWPDWPGNLRVLVVGDVMVDEYRICDAKGVSIEDSRRVDWKSVGHSAQLGGAGNVAARLTEMGAKVTLAGVLGGDSAGMLASGLSMKGYGMRNMRTRLVTDESGITTLKSRHATEDGRVVFRSDMDRMPGVTNDKCVDELIEQISGDSYDVAIVCDHAKGVVTDKLLKTVRECAAKVFIDPSAKRMSDFIGEWWHEVDVVKCNSVEFAARARKMGIKDVLSGTKPMEVWKSLRGWKARDFTLVGTCGDRGAWLVTNTMGEPLDFFSVDVPKEHRRRVVDVTGAGDEFMAVLALEMGLGREAYWATRLAVAHASEMVQHPRALTLT